MRKQHMWVQHFINTARWQSGLLRASDAKGDAHTDLTPEAAQYMARKGLIRYIGKDEYGRQLWQLKEEYDG